jgi:hypothetical protein
MTSWTVNWHSQGARYTYTSDVSGEGCTCNRKQLVHALGTQKLKFASKFIAFSDVLSQISLIYMQEHYIQMYNLIWSFESWILTAKHFFASDSSCTQSKVFFTTVKLQNIKTDIHVIEVND